MLLLFVLLLFLYLVYVSVRPLPPRPNATMLRKILRSRMHAHGTPRLCGYHLGSRLRPGQMAIVDSARCEDCRKEGKSQTK